MRFFNKNTRLQKKQDSNHGLPLWADKIIALVLIAFLSPLMLLNSLIAKLSGKKAIATNLKIDALGRNTTRMTFTSGVIKNSAALLQVLTGKIRLCGATCNYRLTPSLSYGSTLDSSSTKSFPSGLVSLHDVHEKSGLAVATPESLYQQQSQMCSGKQLSLLCRFVFNWIFYPAQHKATPALVPLFGLNINNTQMEKAVNWFADGSFFRGIKRSSLNLRRPKISFFVNANSINLAQRNNDFKEVLKRADCLFADGSGMRLAAKIKQVKLIDNINGTDVLPLLCEVMQKSNKRLFLLGAKPGVAKKTAQNLKQKWPSLQISGIQDGYYKAEDEQAIIERINQSQTDVLLVAQGSPLQESWIINNARALDCESVLAVGGLFDFYSGNIARAPMWMRETGLEWFWRLSQEPVTKFKRYVIGVPEFMFRTFVLKQVCQE